MFYRNSLDPALVCCEVLTLARCVPCVCVAPADFIEMGRHYYSQVTWSHSTYTPIHHPHLCAPARGRHHHQPISNIINIQALKTIFCAFRFPRSFLTASQAQAPAQGRNKKRKYENQSLQRLLPTIEWCTDFSRNICQHQTFNSEALFISLTTLVESLVMGWRLETFLPGAHQINKAPLSTFLGTSSYHHYNFILQPWSDFLLQPSWAGQGLATDVSTMANTWWTCHILTEILIERVLKTIF